MPPDTLTSCAAIGTALAFAGYASALTSLYDATEATAARTRACEAFAACNPAASTPRVLQASAVAHSARTPGAPYLTIPIAESIRAYPSNPRAGMTACGYTTRRGAPTSLMIRLHGEKRLRRLMIWQFSNAGTCFIRVAGAPYIVPDYAVPVVKGDARP